MKPETIYNMDMSWLFFKKWERIRLPAAAWMLLLRDEKEMNFQIDSSGKVY
ncbi:MAG: hypothetical protein HFH32_04745 [Eubacterium sp.]|jgi:hypothetical protein|nr:hypothetical protein [Eubacterium sp.]